MSQGNDFANYSASSNARATASEDVWFVAVASDDIKQMNVEQLDEAFRLGVITAETAVWTEGMEAWAPLGEVADLGADDDESDDSSDEPQSAVSHAAATHAAATHAAAPQHHHAAAHHHHHHAAPATSGVSFAPVTLQSMHSNGPNSFAAGPSSVAPVTASFAPPSPFVQSTVPVALNVDEDMPPIRVGRRFRPERWLLAVAAVAGLGVTAYNNSDLFASSPAPVAAAAVPAAAPVSKAYDVGGGVEKGASMPSKEDGDEPSKLVADDAPIGASSSTAAKESLAKEAAKEEPAAVAAPSKENLKGSFTKAFNKKAPAAKPAKAAKAAKQRKTASRAAAPKAKKSSAPKAASAFDPLNGSLP